MSARKVLMGSLNPVQQSLSQSLTGTPMMGICLGWITTRGALLTGLMGRGVVPTQNSLNKIEELQQKLNGAPSEFLLPNRTKAPTTG
jgi:hypothetical protein